MIDAPIVSTEALHRWFPNETSDELTHLRDAAESHIRKTYTIGSMPNGDVKQAVRLMVARHLARRNSPDGTLGMSEFGVGRIATVDRDIEQLLAPYRRVAFG